MKNSFEESGLPPLSFFGKHHFQNKDGKGNVTS
jgi:hypothetical protein